MNKVIYLLLIPTFHSCVPALIPLEEEAAEYVIENVVENVEQHYSKKK